MAKESGKKSFLDFFKMKDLDDDDEFDDDLFDEDDDDDEDDYMPSKPPKKSASFGQRSTAAKPQQVTSRQSSYADSGQASSYRNQAQQPSYGQRQSKPASNNKLVDFNTGRQHSESYRGRSEVYVIRPQEINEAQTVTDFLKRGKTIVINMEGVEIPSAQRIIDFIGGACYALDGSLQAISANIFIAAPNNIEVTGDLREEILNESTVSPELGRF